MHGENGTNIKTREKIKETLEQATRKLNAIAPILRRFTVPDVRKTMD